jgi:uncharacterized DUF497 family protein
MQIDGFEWDEGNWPKCAKHGISKQDIEIALTGDVRIFEDPTSPDNEKRYRAIGLNDVGRHVLVVFCIRHQAGRSLLRPISARFMHQKEISYYEQQTKA